MGPQRRAMLACGALAAAFAFAFLPVHRLGADVPATRDTLRLEAAAEPHTLQSILTTTQEEYYLVNLVNDPLVAFDGERRPHPMLITTIPTQANGGISADGRTITLHLRHNVKWHDGVAFTATDVLFTIHAVLDPKNTVVNRSSFTSIDRVDAPDPYTVVVHLKAPQSSFLATVGTLYPIVPAHLLAKSANLATDPYNASPVGTGPYKFVRWSRGERLEYEANPDYWAGAPHIKRVSVAFIPDQNTLGIAVREGEVDYSAANSATYNQLRDDSAIVRKTEPLNDFNAVAINATRPLVRDLRVREALIKGVDRKAITQSVTFGTGSPAYGDLPLFMYNGRPPAGWDAYDPAGAAALLQAAGWKPGPDGIRMKDGVPLRLQLISLDGNPTAASIVVQIQQMLKAIGVDLIVKSFSPSLYYSPASAGGPMMRGEYDLAVFQFISGSDTTNSEIYTCASRIPAGFNSANYCSPEMERLQAASLRAYDPAARDAIVAQIENLAVHDATYLFLYHTPYRILMNPALQRPVASPDNEWYGIATWYFAPPKN